MLLSNYYYQPDPLTPLHSTISDQSSIFFPVVDFVSSVIRQENLSHRAINIMSLPKHPRLSLIHGIIGFIACFGGMAAVIKLMLMAYNDELNILSLAGVKVDSSQMKTFSDKFEFTVKYWTPGLVWLYFYIHIVIFRRFATGALIPNTQIEYLVANQRSILTQSIEQFLFAVVTQMAILPYLTSSQVINVIPVANLLFFVGRLFFWLGYPKFRTLGVVTTMAPFSVMLWFLTVQFTRENNLLSLAGLGQAVPK